jgi:hypothetical protein
MICLGLRCVQGCALLEDDRHIARCSWKVFGEVLISVLVGEYDAIDAE